MEFRDAVDGDCADAIVRFTISIPSVKDNADWKGSHIQHSNTKKSHDLCLHPPLHL